MKIATIIILSISLFFVACSDQPKEEAKENEKVESEALHLNDGQKWEVNEETHEGMNRIQVLLENGDPLTLEDYHFMAEKMDDHTDYIIHNCSMTGEAHEQLHHVLHPILDLISDLHDAKDMDQAGQITFDIETNLQDYFNHFTHP